MNRGPSGFEFDERMWSERVSSSPIPGGVTIIAPRDVVSINDVRRRAALRRDLGKSVPCDVFVIATGEPSRRDITKIGGLPYRPAGLPWPETEDGPMTFVCQYRFVESQDIIPALPGDILLMFARELGLYTGDPPYFHYEWYPGGIEDLIRPEDVVPPAWTFFNGYGLRYRTVDYVETAAEQAVSEIVGTKPEPTLYGYDYDVRRVCHLHAVKIGGLPFRMTRSDRDPSLGGRFLCSLAAISPQPSVTYPWANQAEAITEASCWHDDRLRLVWYDSAWVHFFLGEEGHIRHEVEY